jgi:hypothetical protein
MGGKVYISKTRIRHKLGDIFWWAKTAHWTNVLAGLKPLHPTPKELFIQKRIFYSPIISKWDNTVPNFIKQKTNESENVKIGKTVWFLRWNGMEGATIVEQKCFKAAKQWASLGNFDLILITKYNYLDYLYLNKSVSKILNESFFDDNIINSRDDYQKINSINDFYQEKLPPLPDFLANYLIAKYGGLVINSTIFLTHNKTTPNPIVKILSKPFFSPAEGIFNNCSFVTKRGMWQMNCLASNYQYNQFFCATTALWNYFYSSNISRKEKQAALKNFECNNILLQSYYMIDQKTKNEILQNRKELCSKFNYFYRYIDDKPYFTPLYEFKKLVRKNFCFKLDRHVDIPEITKQHKPTMIHWLYESLNS